VSGLSRFSKVREARSFTLRSMARTPFASMQQCPAQSYTAARETGLPTILHTEAGAAFRRSCSPTTRQPGRSRAVASIGPMRASYCGIDTADATWTIPGRGPATPHPLIKR
jgi:hypothetical protein